MRMENEKIKNNLPNLEIVISFYESLCGKPEPEEEEEAQIKMGPIFKSWLPILEDNSEFQAYVQEIFDLVDNWDPLESWFFEIPELKQKMGEFLLKICPDHDILNTIFPSTSNAKNIIQVEDVKSAKIKTIDGEKTEASGLISPVVEIGSSLIQNIEKNTLETDFQKQILQNSIDEEKQAKIEKRLQEMESKMANLMEKEGRIKQHQKGGKLNQINTKTSTNSEVLGEKPEDSILKSSLNTPKFNIPNVPKPKKKILPENIRDVDEPLKNSPIQSIAPIPIKITPQISSIQRKEQNISSFSNGKKIQIKNIQVNSSFQDTPEIVSIQHVPTSKNHGSSNSVRITNINVSSRIIRPTHGSLEEKDHSQKENFSDDDFKPVNAPVRSKQDHFQKMIELESKKYYLEKSLRELETTFANGLLSEENYHIQISKCNSELFNYSTSIENLRTNIQN